MENRILPLATIESLEAFVLFSGEEGLISSHARAAQSMRALATHMQSNPTSKAKIYERTPQGWEMIA